MKISKYFKNPAEAAEVKVHFSTIADVSRVFNFYAAYQHEHVDLRAEDLLRTSTENGRIFMAIHEPTSTIMMSSSAYDYDDPRTNTVNKSWVEIGSTRAAVDGLGLYPFTIASQVIHEFITRPPEDFFFASIYNNNDAVAAMLSGKVGWSFFDPEDTLIDVSGERENMDKLIWLRADTTSIPHQARLVLSVIERLERDGLRNKRTNEVYKINFQNFPLANELRPILKELAYGQYGKILENTPALNMRQASDTLKESMANRLPALRHEL